MANSIRKQHNQKYLRKRISVVCNAQKEANVNKNESTNVENVGDTIISNARKCKRKKQGIVEHPSKRSNVYNVEELKNETKFDLNSNTVTHEHTCSVIDDSNRAKVLNKTMCVQDTFILELSSFDISTNTATSIDWFKSTDHITIPKWKYVENYDAGIGKTTADLKNVNCSRQTEIKTKSIASKTKGEKNLSGKTMRHTMATSREKNVKRKLSNSDTDSESALMTMIEDWKVPQSKKVNNDYLKMLEKKNTNKLCNLKIFYKEQSYIPCSKTVELLVGKRFKYAGTHVAAFYQRPLFQQVREELCPSASKSDYLIDRFLYPQHRLLLSELAKKCLLSHQWRKLTVVMLGLCYTPSHLPEMLWKIGCTLLKSIPCGQPFLSSFQNSMKLLCHHIHKPEVYIDVANAIIMNKQNLHEAYQSLTATISKEPFSSDIYFNLFYGQLEHAMWKVECNRNTAYKSNVQKTKWTSDDEDSDDEMTTAEQNTTSQLSFHGHRALQYLHCVEERMGLWDRLLPKYLELVSYYEGKVRAVEVAKKHLQINRDNPNAYRFLYLLLKDDEEDKVSDVLKELAMFDPTNKLVDQLIVYYTKTKSYTRLFDLLIQRVDHVSCFDSYFDWSALFTLIRSQRQAIDTKLEELGRNRPTWMKINFPVPLNATNQRLSERTLRIKSDIAHFLNVEYYSECVASWLDSRTIKYEREHKLHVSKFVTLLSGSSEVIDDDIISNLSTPDVTDIETSEYENDFFKVERDLFSVHDEKSSSCCSQERLLNTDEDLHVLNVVKKSEFLDPRTTNSSISSLSSDEDENITRRSRAKNKKRKVVRSRKSQKTFKNEMTVTKTGYDTVSPVSSSSDTEVE